MKLKNLLFVVALVAIYSFNSMKSSQKITQNNDITEIWYLKTKDEKVDLFVKEIGIGDTIVVVHGGFGAEHSYLLDPLEKLKNRFHFIFYDQRGSLRSTCPDSLISVNKHIEDLEVLRDELKISKLNLLGHSMGTYLCGAYLEKYPDKVKSMTLLALVYPYLLKTDEFKDSFNKQQKAASEFIKRPEIEAEIEKNNFNKDTLTDKEEIFKWQINFAGANIYDMSKWKQVKGGRAFYNGKAGSAAGKTLPMNTGWNFIDAYKATGIPITVINGSHDFADMGGLMYREPLEKLPNVEYFMIDKAAHNTWIDKPIIFEKHLLKALSK